MAVINFREVLPRTFAHKFGEGPTSERKFVATLDVPTPHQQILNSIGIFHGATHPEFSYLRCVEGQITETDRQHAEVTYRYEVPTSPEFEASPLSRRDVWSFSVGGAQVPALNYFHGDSGNGDVRPLVNAAGDFFEGLTATEAEVRATINSNRPTFDLTLASNVTNAINGSPYLGGDRFTWLCAGIAAQQTSEVVNDIRINYWQLTVELIYRRSSWLMYLPHIGWHYLEGTGSNRKKERAYVFSTIDGAEVKVPASSPQPLTETGGLKYQGREGFPELLQRRLNPIIDFAPFFGTPQF
jgi:hypothetical protein